MTNKEKREEYKECIYAIIKDLDLLDKYKKIMCKPILDIMKDLEVLEILKKRMNIKIPYGSVNVISANNDDDYLLFEVELKEHTKIEEWLENGK